MTTLASWVGRDSHGDASLYIASDSQLSRANQNGSFAGVLSDRFQKTFHAEFTPDIFGVFGSVAQAEALIMNLLPRLAAIREQIDGDHLPHTIYGRKVSEAIESSDVRSDAPTEWFTIVHGTRFEKSHFRLFRYRIRIMEWSIACSASEIPIPGKFGLRCTGSSGDPVIVKIQREDAETDARGLSRWQWQTFCDAVGQRDDPFTGGAPQLVALYREGNGAALGVYFQGAAYRCGARIAVDLPVSTEFRDELFQRVNREGSLLPGAQRHARNPRRAIVSPFPF